MSQKITYLLMNPSGNRTILVKTPAEPKDQPSIAKKLMKLEPSAEQAGFLSKQKGSDIRLRMAGGEFCGNATMCAAVSYAIDRGITEGSVLVSVSGAPEPVRVSLWKQAETWNCTVEMPAAESVEQVVFTDGKAYPVVRFEGIAHVILEEEIPGPESEELVKQWCAFLGAEAAGLMYLNRREGCLTPLVYVPEADTLCWENACGSGTTAVAAYCFSKKQRETRVSLKQPGGVLEAKALPNGKLFLSGMVEPEGLKTVNLK